MKCQQLKNLQFYKRGDIVIGLTDRYISIVGDGVDICMGGKVGINLF